MDRSHRTADLVRGLKNTMTVDAVSANQLQGQSSLEAAYGKVTRRLVPPLLLAYIVAYLDRVNVGFAKLQMLKQLHFSDTIYGLGAGIFFVGYFIFGVPSNMILRRVGARVWIATLMISWSLVSASMVLVTNPTVFYVLRFFLGVAEAGFFPGVIFYFTQWYPHARRSKVTAVFMTSIAICGAIGSVLSGWIMQSFDGQSGWAGWKWLFVLEAAPALLIGLYLLVRLDNDLAGASWLSTQERSMLAKDLAQDSAAKPTGSVGGALRDGRVWAACAIYFCAMTGLYGIGFWLPTLIAQLGIAHPLYISMLAAIPYTFAGLGMVLVGRNADRTGERRWHVAIPSAVGALGLALSAAFSGHVTLAMCALTLATAGTFVTAPLFWSLPTAYLRGVAAAAGIAFINSFGCLAGFASPYLIGWIKDATGSTNAGMYLIAAVTFAGAAIVILAIPAKSLR
jgi:MFS family permease